ncbi:hypothetical protein DRN75_01770 [Nanoarchaeota archaeon]|nr:MAG: hypothetical protein DRN75_01770 [Nanoarchaeota archaeon]
MLMDYTPVLKRVKMSPKRRARLVKIVNELCEVISSNLGVEAVPKGSLAKGTELKTSDVDIFVRFDSEEDMKRFIPFMRKFDPEIKHGSRDYVKVRYKGVEIEVVPVLKVPPERAENTMDLSYYHEKYVKDHLSKPDDVRLLKQFCKAQGVYGAESSVGGLSGYLVELLVINYGSFENVIKSVAKWKPPVVVDVEGHHSLEDALTMFKTPLVVIDPVHKYRNLGAAVHPDVLYKFILSCRLFLANPSYKFFTIGNMVDSVKRRSVYRGTYLVSRVVKVRGDEDVFVSKLKKKLSTLVRNIDLPVYDYGVVPSGDKVFVYVELEYARASRRRIHVGPPVWIDDHHFLAFLKKHKKVYPVGDRVCADVLRRYKSISDVRKALSKLL